MTSISTDAGAVPGPSSRTVRTSLAFVALAAVLCVFADFEISTLDPMVELRRMAIGAVTPDFLATENLLEAVFFTLAFALVGVAIANVVGMGLALAFHYRAVRAGCAFIRAVHELFWALIFLQIFGLTPLTGVLAIAIPYTGIFAKVYSEILEEADQRPMKNVPIGTGAASAFLFVRLPDAWVHFKIYSLYRPNVPDEVDKDTWREGNVENL